MQRNRERDLRHALREIRESIDAYKRAGDEGRILRSPDQSGYPPALTALVDGVTDAKSPNGAKIYFFTPPAARLPSIRNPIHRRK